MYEYEKPFAEIIVLNSTEKLMLDFSDGNEDWEDEDW